MASDAMTIPSAPPLLLPKAALSDQSGKVRRQEFALSSLADAFSCGVCVQVLKLIMFNYRSTKDSPELAAIAGS